MNTNLFREMIKYPFELHYKPSSYELNDYIKKCINIYKILDDFNIKNEDAFFKLVKLVFKKRLNITKKLKLEKFHKFSDGYIIYNGKFKGPYSGRLPDGSWEKGEKWHEVRVEVEIDDYKITANIVFMETGEIKQSQLRFDR